MTKITEVTGGITAPPGFLAAAVAADIKGKGDQRLDLALIYSQTPAVAAAVYTTNLVQAAPILVAREHLAAGQARAVVANSGNANACTGQPGLAAAREMCAVTAAVLSLKPSEVVVASTGVIGVPLPMARVREGIERCAPLLSDQGGADAARAIMTTDTFPKEWSIQVELPTGRCITLGGMSKGSGMIHPNMATMLGFITTDAAIASHALQTALSQAVAKSFNMITVDGDTSTNDMVLILANGRAGNPEIGLDSDDYQAFCAGLDRLLENLAVAIARDGEGATKLLTVHVGGAPTAAAARQAARAVVGSSLVKAAMYGNDANWGRILAALGYSGIEFSPMQVDLWLGDVQVMARGLPLAFDEAAARRAIAQPEVIIRAELGAGTGQATAWGCDLSYDYVKINADYRT